MQDNLPQNNELSLLTYNVWTGNSSANQHRLTTFIADKNADIVCLQEVKRSFYHTLFANSKITSEYVFANPPALYEGDFDGELLLIKRKYNPTLFPHVILPQTRQNRHYASASFVVNGVRIAVATAHLESMFFYSDYTKVKLNQLGTISHAMDHTMDPLKPDCCIFAGDCNLTGGNQLQAENDGIEQLKLTDVWKFFNNTTEDENDEAYRRNDVTWDYAGNNHIKHVEYHRPDRVFIKLFTHQVEPTSIQREVSDMSDHYGLTATFRITP